MTSDETVNWGSLERPPTGRKKNKIIYTRKRLKASENKTEHCGFSFTGLY